AGRRPRVVIVGAGFAGLAAARELRHADAEVLVVDRVNHHTFQPLLYQVATAGLSAPQIASPIRHILRGQANVRVILGEVVHIDADECRVVMEDGELSFDFLIVAAGLTHSYFGHDEWARHAPGLKTLDDALEMRRRVLLAFERAERELVEAEREAWMTFVIIGGGPTGVELAGTLAEIARHTLRDEFRVITPARARVLLLEGGPRILSTYAETLSRKAERQLARLGVEVRVGARVTSLNETGVAVEGAGFIVSRTVLWAAGVRASPLASTLPGEKDRSGRVRVDPLLRVPGYERLFVVGDLALVMQDGQPVPGVGYAAKQMGEYAGGSLARVLRAEKPGTKEERPFRYRDLGALATIGRAAAVAQFPGGLKLSGALAWWAWLLVHIFFLIGFRNRIATLIDWSWSYVTYQRHARLILEPPRASPPAARS
ncbi:MAG: NAD(P)/FAD-dependent oxidoreductase, partial [Burkholderiaceae bacterium]